MRFYALLFVILTAAATTVTAESFTFTSNTMSADMTKGREKTTLKGAARIQSDSTLIQGDQIELYGNNFRYALAKGKVTATDNVKGILIQAEELFFDREKKLTRVQGQAKIEDQKNSMIIKGGFFENRDEDDVLIIQIGVRILKEDMICRSDYARYNRKSEILELSGMPVVIWKGDTYKASRITINTKTNEIQLDGRVSGTVTPSAAPAEKVPPGDPAKASAEAPPAEELPETVPAVPSQETPLGNS